MGSPKKTEKPHLVVRNANTEDVAGIYQLIEKVYPGFPPYPLDMIRGQINSYPEGAFVAVFQDKIVGYCCSIRLPEERALSKHTWREITGGGYGTTHVPNGEYLYGYEVCVDPEFRGLKIGQRFYRARKDLCKYLRLKGIVFGGRMPGLAKHYQQLKGNVEKYIALVQQKKIRDLVLSFQIRNGFEVIGVLPDYLPSDQNSMGYAAHLIWKNPMNVEEKKGPVKKRGRMAGTIRVAAVQYEQRRIKSFKEFSQIVEYFVDVVSDYHADFVLFPELFTLQLLSIANERIPPFQAVEKICDYTDAIKEMFYHLALKYNVNIIGGSHPTKLTDNIQNMSYIYLRDGTIRQQPKIHPTPNEKYWWNFAGGNTVTAIDTDCGPIGVLICYDAEFPELGRHLVDQGANIIFVPFLTDERQSYNRVRYCAHARAIENQCFVVMAGNVGNLPRVNNMDIHYGQSCILTPCDFPFARDGIASDTTPNVETVAIADLSMETLNEARNNGTVKNLKDRRHDLYSVTWHKMR